MVLSVPLEYGNPEHRGHHAHGSHLQPGLAAQPVKEEDWNPCKHEEHNPYTSSGKVRGVRVFNTAAFEEGRLHCISVIYPCRREGVKNHILCNRG